MTVSNDIHFQFAECFEEKLIRPYAYFLSRNLLEGNICIPIDEPVIRRNESPYQEVCDIETLKGLKYLVTTKQEEIAPFILEGNKLYLHRYFRYESIIVNRIKELVFNGNKKSLERMELLSSKAELVYSFNADYPIQPTTNDALKIDWQIVAVLQALLQDFSIITGGPGTGKTTTLAKVLAILYTVEPSARVALTAPTGKASMRMYESLTQTTLEVGDNILNLFRQLKPTTIHSLLGYQRDSVNFKYNSNNPLPFDWIIVDEASMIDVPMFAKVLDAMSDTCRIILLGDKDQLASVEAGSLLGDFCLSLNAINQFSSERADWINSFISDPNRKITTNYIHPTNSLLANNIIELKFSHRFNIEGGIGKLSNAVLTNNQTVIEEYIFHNIDANIHIDTKADDKILAKFCAGYKDFIQETDIKTALKKLNNLRVLVAVREGERGLYAINRKIELELLRLKLINIDNEFYTNRPIMVTRNMYQLGLMNGDVGIIRDGRIHFDVAGEGIRSFLPAYLTDAETVFAMTIHKSQGSEFNDVLIVLPEGIDSPLLTRELLYTGITRAKKSVTIQGGLDSIMQAAGATVKRVSGIREKLVVSG